MYGEGSALTQKQNLLRWERESGGRERERQEEEDHAKGRPWSKTSRTTEKAQPPGLDIPGRRHSLARAF